MEGTPNQVLGLTSFEAPAMTLCSLTRRYTLTNRMSVSDSRVGRRHGKLNLAFSIFGIITGAAQSPGGQHCTNGGLQHPALPSLRVQKFGWLQHCCSVVAHATLWLVLACSPTFKVALHVALHHMDDYHLGCSVTNVLASMGVMPMHRFRYI